MEMQHETGSETTADPQASLIEALGKEWLQQVVDSGHSPAEIFGKDGLFQQLKGQVMDALLRAELTAHLGYERHGRQAPDSNRRNGSTTKTVQTDSGPVTVTVPRDRDGTFAPRLIGKHQRRLAGLDDHVLALYARGMTVRDIQGHLRQLYGTDISPDVIARITDAALEEFKLWQSRPCDAVYPIVYIDALHVPVRDGAVVRKKAVYVVLAVRMDGHREVLGLWVAQTESARFWLSVLTELKNRGVSDIFFLCADGLTGINEAVAAAFPQATMQTCIVHLIRASLKYVTDKDRRPVAADLKAIYTAASDTDAKAALDAFEARWASTYPIIGRQWRARWDEIIPFLAYPPEIRTILYTTNAIESLNYQLRKVMRAKGHFPSDEAMLKILYLAITHASVKWNATRDWKKALAHFAIVFEHRMPA